MLIKLMNLIRCPHCGHYVGEVKMGDCIICLHCHEEIDRDCKQKSK